MRAHKHRFPNSLVGAYDSKVPISQAKSVAHDRALVNNRSDLPIGNARADTFYNKATTVLLRALQGSEAASLSSAITPRNFTPDATKTTAWLYSGLRTVGCRSYADSSNGHRGRRDQVGKGPRYGTTASLRTARIIGRGFPLLEGDVVSTGNHSFAVFTLTDGTKMTLRPNSVFAIEHFSEAQTSAVLKLFKGGFRALTGLIAKTNPKAYLVETPLATIGIRGTKFDA